MTGQPASPHPVSPLLDRCEPALPGSSYYDPDWYAREIRQIWTRNWVYVGRANDLAPMTMTRARAADANLILVKDRDGAISCFHNTCRHRGSELCSQGQRPLTGRRITCPYHQWSYDLEGQLVHTPFVTATADFRKEDYGLYRVQLREWNGFLFACLADAAPDFTTVPDIGAGALDNWPMRDLVTGHVLVTELACNWKVFWENYNECLHCPGIHPELCDMVPVYRRGVMSAEESATWIPGTPPPERSLKAGARTWTMNGQLCGPEFPGLTAAQRAAGFLFVTLLPTMYIVAHADYLRAVSLVPLGPERTELRAEWLFHPETLAAPGFDLANVVDFARVVLEQDGAACEMNQRGLRSPRFERGILMPQEFDVHRLQQWILGQLGAEDTARGIRP